MMIKRSSEAIGADSLCSVLWLQGLPEVWPVKAPLLERL